MGQRPIKFRAWDLEHKRMLYDDIILDMSDCSRHSTFFSFSGQTPALIILLQFTGLHDRHWKEIWEGDIVRYENKYLDDPIHFEVRYDAGSFLQHGEDGDSIWYEWDEVDVIGNIYEHPKLLEVNNGTPNASRNDVG